MKKLVFCFLVVTSNTIAGVSEGSSGEMENIISITPINESQDYVCYQTEDNNITCVIVERN